MKVTTVPIKFTVGNTVVVKTGIASQSITCTIGCGTPICAKINNPIVEFNVGFACSSGLGTQYIHGYLAGLDADDHPQYHNDARGDDRYDGIGSAEAVQTNLNTHVNDGTNPHQVTFLQVGADPAGSSDLVQETLDLHIEDKDNPHETSYDDLLNPPASFPPGSHTHPIGEVDDLQTALDGKSDIDHLHTGVYEPANANIQSHIAIIAGNPHGVTAGDVGADLAGSASVVQDNLDAHEATDNPHNITAESIGAIITLVGPGTYLSLAGQEITQRLLIEDDISDFGLYEPADPNIQLHLVDTSNPHSVTALQVGADPEGSSAAVQADLDSHKADITNPHEVDWTQTGADPHGSAAIVQGHLDTHTQDKSNPHEVTAAQAGADPLGSAAAVQGNLDTHEADKTNPHEVTAAQAGADPIGSADAVEVIINDHKNNIENPHRTSWGNLVDAPDFVLKAGDEMTGTLRVSDGLGPVGFAVDYSNIGSGVWGQEEDLSWTEVMGMGVDPVSGDYGIRWNAPNGHAILETGYSGYLRVQTALFHKDSEAITMPYSYPDGVPSRLLNDGNGNLYFEQIPVAHTDSCSDTNSVPLTEGPLQILVCTATADMPSPSITFHCQVQNTTGNKDDTVYMEFFKNGTSFGAPFVTALPRATTQTISLVEPNGNALIIGDIISVDVWTENNQASCQINGDIDPTTITMQQGSSGGSSPGTDDHRNLNFRDAADQHPVNAITGLQTALDEKADEDHLHTEYVAKTGDQMSGTLIIESSESAALRLDSPTDASLFINFRNSSNVNRGGIRVNTDTGQFRLDSRDASGAVLGTATLEVDGNLSVNGAAPTADADLTRKDYVDNLVATVSSPWDTVTGGINYAGGNVGIGTATPTYKLHVAGDQRLVNQTTGAPVTALQLYSGYDANAGLDAAQRIAFNWEGGSKQSYVEGYSNVSHSSDCGLRFGTRTSASGAIQAMTIVPNGNVGIGTTSPSAKLTILEQTASAKQTQLRLYSNYDGNANLDTSQRITFDWEGGGKSAYIEAYSESLYSANVGLKFGTGVTPDAVTLISTGSVGIGTTSPSEKLEVVGNIKVSGTVIGPDTTWKDANVTGFEYRKLSNGMVAVRFTGTGADIGGTLPADYRPTNTAIVSVNAGTSGSETPAQVWFQSSGVPNVSSAHNSVDFTSCTAFYFVD